MNIVKLIGVSASVVSIISFGVFIYEKTQIDPSREALNRLSLLIESQEKQLQVQQQLLVAINDLGEDAELLLSSSGSILSFAYPELDMATGGLPEGIESTVEVTVPKCELENPNAKVKVARLNVRSAAPILNSLAPILGSLDRGQEFRIEESKASGIFGLGARWHRIAYCNDDNSAEGWVAEKTKDGALTFNTVP